MSRSLVLGNGSLLVCYDEWAQVRDFYFPHVGLENHVGERLMHRIGVFVDGTMHWLSGGGFDIRITYEFDNADNCDTTCSRVVTYLLPR